MKFSFKPWLKNYLDFSKSDRNAIIILSFLIFIAIVANVIIDHIDFHTQSDFSEMERIIDEWEAGQLSVKESGQSLFLFDPNTISEQRLDSLHLPGSIKRNLLNYRKAGGKFRTKTDVARIYGMNDSIYSEIKEFIVIQSQPVAKITSGKPDIVRQGTENRERIDKFHEANDNEALPVNVIIELNRADTTDLMKLNGIGPVFASRILKYRNLLGGFYSSAQLMEVYNFPEETYRSIQNRISVDTTQIKAIRINFAGYSELLRHPYLGKKQVEAIIKFRDQNGPFKTSDQIYRENLVDSATYFRLKPYLSSR